MPLPQLARFLSSPWRLVRLATMLGAGIAATWGLVHQGPLLFPSDPPNLVSTSPDGRWTLDIHAAAGWLYAPHDTRVLARRLDGGWWHRMPGQFRALEFELRNDGASLSSDNLAAAWIAPDSVQIFAHGWEQSDTTYLLDLEAARTSAIGERFALFASLWTLLLLATLFLEALILLFTSPPPGEPPPSPPSAESQPPVAAKHPHPRLPPHSPSTRPTLPAPRAAPSIAPAPTKPQKTPESPPRPSPSPCHQRPAKRRRPTRCPHDAECPGVSSEA